MVLRYLSLMLVGILVFQLLAVTPVAAAVKDSPSSQDSRSQEPPTLKEKFVEVNPGAIIVVKLNSAENVRGRFQSMTDDGFTMQIVKGDKLSERTLAFGDVKSFKVEGTHGAARTVGYVILGGSRRWAPSC